MGEEQLLHDGGEFQIVRDEDFDQTLYPMDPYGFGDTNSTILGPDGNGRDLNWWLGGRAGDVFRIFFERSEDSMQVGWELLRHLDLSAAQLASLARPRYSVVGSWDGWAEAWPMLCEDSECTFFLQLGASCEESFQILEKGRWETTLYPDREDAHPSSGYRLCGPGSAGHGLNWTVGRYLHDAGAPGKCYKIVLVLNTVDGIPRVEWDTLDSTVDVHSVMNEGFFA